jgi:3-hydroxyisobutyrate dehydrogenase-like beta-hydroxyacid dehydrogenase
MTDASDIRVGFVGVGRMGGAMATKVAEAGFPLTVYDVNADATAPLAGLGATVAASPRAVAEQSDLVSIVVLDDEQVREVMVGRNGVLEGGRPHLAVAVHSTIHLSTLLDLAEQTRAAGIEFIDAGVSGYVTGAAKGELAVMLGGDEASIERLRPAFETYGGLVLRMGPLGSGMKAKLARNVIAYLQVTAEYEGMRLAERAGIDLGQLARIVRYSEERSRLVDGYLGRPTVAPLDPGAPEHAMLLGAGHYVTPVMRKDLGAAIELATEMGVDLPVAELARSLAAAVWGIE